MTTTVTAAVQWTGDSFDIPGGDIPAWIVQALGASKMSFDPPTATITTPDGDVTANELDWVYLAQAVGNEGDEGYVAPGLGVTDNVDFRTNYEIAA